MSLTYGFYNSLNGDRRYDAMQMSAIFDGIINDGIFMSVGNHMTVSAAGGMDLVVGTGRAWFNHTWTLNDSTYALEVAEAEILLPRIDVVVLEINSTSTVRANSFKIIQGEADNNPVAPALINTDTVHQHKLAEIYVGANVESITQANITNYIGTTATPFITGILETMDITELVAQWGDEWEQWKLFYENKENTWFTQNTTTFTNQFYAWSQNYIATANEFKSTNEAAFTAWSNAMKQSMETFETVNEQQFTDWSTALEAEMELFTTTNMLAFTTWLDEVKTKWVTTIPKATSTMEGVVKPDNETIFVNDGTISAIPEDDFLSAVSTNGVQNRVVTKALIDLIDGFARGERRAFVLDGDGDIINDRDASVIFGALDTEQ